MEQLAVYFFSMRHLVKYNKFPLIVDRVQKSIPANPKSPSFSSSQLSGATMTRIDRKSSQPFNGLFEELRRRSLEFTLDSILYDNLVHRSSL
jgi:hypothetical protein